jgi:DHA1 family tetracycline resistance protein-like MFS transporter
MADSIPSAQENMPAEIAPGPETPVSATRFGQAAFIFIFITILLDFLALGIIAPVLPNLIIQFKGGNIAGAASITGYFGFAWATMQFIFSPILGAWSDRFGRRPIILISCAGLGFDYILMALAPTLGWLFLGRLISGITTSNISTAFAYVTDVTPPERRAKKAWHMANPLGSLTLLRSHPELGGLAIVTFLYYLAHQVLPSIFVLYADYRYGWSERTIGLSLAAVGVCVSLASGLLVGPFVKRFGERYSLLSGLTFGFLAFTGFALASRGWMAFASIPLIALWGIAGPAMQSLMSQRVDPTSQGKLQGAVNSLRAITGMIGPLLFTQVFAIAISPHVSVHVPGAPYYLAASLMLASASVAYIVGRPAVPAAAGQAASEHS